MKKPMPLKALILGASTISLAKLPHVIYPPSASESACEHTTSRNLSAKCLWICVWTNYLM